MITITREQAICMLYCVPFNDGNVKKFVPTIDALENLEICYKEDPMEPMVVCIHKMNAYPFLYKSYAVKQKESHTEDSTGVNENQTCLVSKAQVANFLNIVFLPADPFNKEVYDCKQVETKDILSFIKKYSHLFDKQRVNDLGKWLKATKVRLVESPIKRIYLNKKDKRQVRNLFVLKDEYIAGTLKNVVSYLDEYQTYIKSLKKDSHSIIGYARKSRGKESQETRIKLLELMTKCLKERSLVDCVYVSYSSNAGDRIQTRDKKQGVGLEKGNTQDMLRYLKNNEKVCLVVIDFAGLSTNTDDLQQFVSENESLKKIIVDTMPFNNRVAIFDRQKVLDEPQTLKAFECRDRPYQRSI